MDVFRTDRIRNVVLLGHSGSGKTSLTEAMAYLSGMTNRLGNLTKKKSSANALFPQRLSRSYGEKIRSMFWILLECLIS